jgi:hypothetical protein
MEKKAKDEAQKRQQRQWLEEQQKEAVKRQKEKYREDLLGWPGSGFKIRYRKMILKMILLKQC